MTGSGRRAVAAFRPAQKAKEAARPPAWAGRGFPACECSHTANATPTEPIQTPPPHTPCQGARPTSPPRRPTDRTTHESAHHPRSAKQDTARGRQGPGSSCPGGQRQRRNTRQQAAATTGGSLDWGLVSNMALQGGLSFATDQVSAPRFWKGCQAQQQQLLPSRGAEVGGWLGAST